MGDIVEAIEKMAIPKFDVLCGGFPCQTFSKAGLQNGFKVVENERGEKDERGQLFYRIIDILKEHPECKFIVLENVRNLADKKENWDVICDELKKQDFVITEEPLIVSPHTFGVPQVRERVFILGIRSSALDKRKKLPKGYLTSDVLHIDKYKKPITDKDNCLSAILDDDVDVKYCVSPAIEEILNIWEEFREHVKGLMSPFWIHKAGIGIYNRELYLSDPEIGFQAMPLWKQKLVMKSRIMYENNSQFIDDWIAVHDMRNRNMLHQKFEWNVGTDCETMKDGIIQIRQSGIRVKRPN
jgi:DNA (cytosine-5)-methyltransferase 1